MGLQVTNNRIRSSPNRLGTRLNLPQEIFLHHLSMNIAPRSWSPYTRDGRRKRAGRVKALIHTWTKSKAAPGGWARFIYDPLANSPPRDKHNIRANWGPAEGTGLWSRPLIPAITAYLRLPCVQRGASETSHPTAAKASDSHLNWALIQLWRAKWFRISVEK